MFAVNSGHTIQIDEPQAAVAAILQMVRRERKQVTVHLNKWRKKEHKRKRTTLHSVTF